MTHAFLLAFAGLVLMTANLAADAEDAAAQIPPAAAGAKERIEHSPRHGEYADVPMGEGKALSARMSFIPSARTRPRW